MDYLDSSASDAASSGPTLLHFTPAAFSPTEIRCRHTAGNAVKLYEQDSSGA
jgi:hypothetical protein